MLTQNRDINIIKMSAIAPQTAKQDVCKILIHLPDDCSLEDIQYRLYVLQKIKRGLKDAEEGRIYTRKEVEKRMAKWVSFTGKEI